MKPEPTILITCILFGFALLFSLFYINKIISDIIHTDNKLHPIDVILPIFTVILWVFFYYMHCYAIAALY